MLRRDLYSCRGMMITTCSSCFQSVIACKQGMESQEAFILAILCN